ncbi:hypothetical protein AtubIFM57258_004409 [Aspergillus tubingensis]|nr:hypothetical protein AtubIFM57258_004409 [Aspergillus tubingensis]
MPSDSNTGASTYHEEHGNRGRGGRGGDRDRGRRGGWRPRRCRFCGRGGHFIANCYLYRGIEILGARRVAIEWQQRLQRRRYRVSTLHVNTFTVSSTGTRTAATKTTITKTTITKINTTTTTSSNTTTSNTTSNTTTSRPNSKRRGIRNYENSRDSRGSGASSRDRKDSRKDIRGYVFSVQGP